MLNKISFDRLVLLLLILCNLFLAADGGDDNDGDGVEEGLWYRHWKLREKAFLKEVARKNLSNEDEQRLELALGVYKKECDDFLKLMDRKYKSALDSSLDGIIDDSKIEAYIVQVNKFQKIFIKKQRKEFKRKIKAEPNRKVKLLLKKARADLELLYASIVNEQEEFELMSEQAEITIKLVDAIQIIEETADEFRNVIEAADNKSSIDEKIVAFNNTCGDAADLLITEMEDFNNIVVTEALEKLDPYDKKRDVWIQKTATLEVFMEFLSNVDNRTISSAGDEQVKTNNFNTLYNIIENEMNELATWCDKYDSATEYDY